MARSHARRPAMTLMLLAMTVLIVRDAHAQPSGQPPAPAAPTDAPCPRPPHACPPPFQMSTWVSLTLKPAGGVCRFDPQSLDTLDLHIGDDVAWEFCSECPADMDVQLDTADLDGPFNDFDRFTPPPMSDNEIHTTVGCHGFGSIRGRRALSGGQWKYSMRVRPVGSTNFPEVIDPRLEIDDYFRRRNMFSIGGLILGLIGGWFVARWWFQRRRQA